MTELDRNNIPQHVAIIMDGNGRWAKQQGKMRVFGHKNGVAAVREAVSYARKIGVKYLTLYAFSSENWNRPEQEVSALMNLFMQALDFEVKKLHKNDIRLKILGDISRFSAGLQEKIKKAQNDLELIKSSYMNSATNGTDDTAPTFKAFEEGSKVTSKEENTALAIRQEKFIRDLKNALIRIENKTYGICRVTGKLIDKRRLMAVPHATLSIEAKNMQ